MSNKLLDTLYVVLCEDNIEFFTIVLELSVECETRKEAIALNNVLNKVLELSINRYKFFWAMLSDMDEIKINLKSYLLYEYYRVDEQLEKIIGE